MKKFLLLTLLTGFLFASDMATKVDECQNDRDYNACNFVGDDLIFKGKNKEAGMFYLKAKELMTQACSKNDFSACYNLAFNYEMGTVVYPKDDVKALEYYKKTIAHNVKVCEMGNAGSCFNTGLDYSDDTLLKDMEKATEYFTKACSLGMEAACKKVSKS